VYYSDPVSDVVECFLVEEQVLEPCQRAILVHSTTLLEHVAVAFEVVARRTYVTQCQTTNEQPSTQQVRISQITQARTHAHTHTPFNGPLSGTTRVGRYQKGKNQSGFS